MTKCTNNIGVNGQCCCNCTFQAKIMSHPWNTYVGGRMKGPVTTIAGYGCTVMVPDGGGIIFFEEEHSVCEMHTFKGI